MKDLMAGLSMTMGYEGLWSEQVFLAMNFLMIYCSCASVHSSVVFNQVADIVI